MGQRGPQPMPDNVHKLRGTKPRAQPAPGGAISPKVEAPSYPKWMKGEALTEWRRIVPELKALGLIAQIDRAVLIDYCTAWAEFVLAERKILEAAERDPQGEAGHIETTPNGFRVKAVWLTVRDRALERLHKAAALFGMSPAARARVTPSNNIGHTPDMFAGTEAAKPGIAQFRN